MSDQTEYRYIREAYGVEPVVGQRVSVDGALGTLVAPTPGSDHYLHVHFDLNDKVLIAHPTWRVNYSPEEPA